VPAVAGASNGAYPPGSFGGEQVGRIGSSSNMLASPYPAGSSAAVAAGGSTAAAPGGFNTAAAQQAARAAGAAGSPSRR
jgi:hypothetical protein